MAFTATPPLQMPRRYDARSAAATLLMLRPDANSTQKVPPLVATRCRPGGGDNDAKGTAAARWTLLPSSTARNSNSAVAVRMDAMRVLPRNAGNAVRAAVCAVRR